MNEEADMEVCGEAESASEALRLMAEVGRLVGLTNERVRQIEKKSLIKIREAVEQHYAA